LLQKQSIRWRALLLSPVCGATLRVELAHKLIQALDLGTVTKRMR
jgi:hypothetical protein